MGVSGVHQFLSLCNAETVLFVYDDEGESFELDVFLYDCVGADDDC